MSFRMLAAGWRRACRVKGRRCHGCRGEMGRLEIEWGEGWELGDCLPQDRSPWGIGHQQAIVWLGIVRIRSIWERDLSGVGTLSDVSVESGVKPRGESGCGRRGFRNLFPSQTPSLTLHPVTPPATAQKLKDEIADVFAQIDCFETAEER